MAAIRARRDNGLLFVDFYYQGKRCREQTLLPDAPANRKKLEKVLTKIEEDISLGTFDYAKYFPGSKMLVKLAATPMATSIKAVAAAVSGIAYPPPVPPTPMFRDFAETWFAEKSVEWRESHKVQIRSDLDRLLIPRFGDKEVGQIAKADLLAFRAELAKVQARRKETKLSNQRINKLMAPVRMILNEAADRFDFRTPFANVKQLKIRKTDVHPFSLDEVQKLITTIRADYKPYLTVRFFTAMRTSETHGLKWKYVDFERRMILVRETLVQGRTEYTKNDGSQRHIDMSQTVYDALKQQEKATRHLSEYVFCNGKGQPLDAKNFTNRVWHPLLRHLKLDQRRPYQCRHTCATLWLASGESPQWIAAQLGHVNTEMLFRVYARFVPNLTRKDGSAFDRLITGAFGTGLPQLSADAANESNSPKKEISNG